MIVMTTVLAIVMAMLVAVMMNEDCDSNGYGTGDVSDGDGDW